MQLIDKPERKYSEWVIPMLVSLFLALTVLGSWFVLDDGQVQWWVILCMVIVVVNAILISQGIKFGFTEEVRERGD